MTEVRWTRMAVAMLLTLVPFGTAQSTPTDPAPVDSGRARFVICRPDQGLDRDALRTAILARDIARAETLVAAHVARLAAADDPLDANLVAADATLVERFWLIDAVLVDAPATAAATLAALPGVRSLHRDTTRAPGAHPLPSGPLPIRRMTDGSNHRTDAVHQAGIRGSGVALAVIDTGFDAASGLTGRPHRTFFPNGNLAANGGGLRGSRLLANVRLGILPADNGLDHGTKVAAVAAGGTWSAPSGDDGQAPEAGIVGYAISDLSNGFASLSTMVRAWQQATLDAARYGTKVVNLSYDGTNTPISPEQQAIDAAVAVADLVAVAMAGNNQNSFFHQGAANVLAVGSVELDTQVLSSFSARGGLPPGGSEVYPHLVATGQDLRVPTVDDETIDTSANGTSYSSAAVAGMATLFRSVATAASAEETRAAILATTEDVFAQNRGNQAAIGYGYGRTDRLVALAGGEGRTAAARVTVGTRSWQTRLAVAAGREYRVALSWSQRVIGDADWADLDLFVRQNGRSLAASTNVASTNEVCTFTAIADGEAVIEVFAAGFESGTADQPFGVAIYDPHGLGTIQAYGSGCGRPTFDCGTTPCPSVEPFVATAAFGNASSSDFFGDPTSRTQVYYRVDPTSGGAAFQARALLLRFDEAQAVGATPPWVEIEIDIGCTEAAPAQIGNDFAANRAAAGMTTAFARKRFQLPGATGPGTSPRTFDVVIPFDAVFYRFYDRRNGGFGWHQNVLLDVKVWSNGLGTSFAYPLDAVRPATATDVITLRATSPTATTGTLTPGLGTVIALATGSGSQSPALTGSGSPSLGGSYLVNVNDLPAGVPVRLNLGLSRTTFLGLPLPLALAPIGAPDCAMLASIDGGISATSSATGTAGFTVPVPSDPTLVGFRLFHQAVAVDQRANTAGIALSNGLAVTIGR